MSEALRVVSREHLPEVRRWAMPAVERVATPSDPAPRPTVAELEAISEQARQDGHAQGLAEGRERARVELQQQQQQLRALCDALARPLQQVDAAVERQLAELAMLVARGVLQAELERHPEHLLRVVRKAIAALPAATANIDIQVPPATAALLQEGLTEASENGWRIVADPQLKPGDCRIVGADSRIDADIETRLAAMVAAALNDDVALPASVDPDAPQADTP